MSVADLPVERQDRLLARLSPHLNEFVAQRPTTKQAAFLLLDQREAFYGGAAGPGKSSGLLMGALQYVDQPDYAALIIRRSFKQLSLPGALMARSHEWLAGTGAHWSAGASTVNGRLVPGKSWVFPSGSTLTFAHLGLDRESRRQFESAEFNYIGVDELTAFDEDEYRFLFSRLRRRSDSRVPTRMRSASNPGGRGHGWVKQRFVNPLTRLARAVFIRATLDDNPHLDRDDYVASLQELHPTTWRRLLMGDWEAADAGEMFQPRVWYGDHPDLMIDVAPNPQDTMVAARYWDLAAAEPTEQNPDPDWTAGVKVSRQRDGLWTIEHVTRWRRTPAETERELARTAEIDGPRCVQYVEQVPGAGAALVSHLVRDVFPATVRVRPDPVKGNKPTRAIPLAAAMEKGKVRIVRGPWLDSFFDEMEAFSEDPHRSGPHDDQVDAASGAFSKTLRSSSGGIAGSRPRGTLTA